MQLAIKTIIIDNEIQSRISLETLIHEINSEFVILGSAADVTDGLELIRKTKPDLVLLDIQLESSTGFELLQQCHDITFDVVFITAYDHYALKAFRFSALDYLLKPVIPLELNDALQKVKSHYLLKNNQVQERIEFLTKRLKIPGLLIDSITIAIPDGFTVVPLKDIFYCLASGNYTHFHLQGGKKIISAYTLKHYDEILTDYGFFRAHKSSLINLSHVKEYRKGEGGIIIMSNDDEIELSRNHKDEFLKFFRR